VEIRPASTPEGGLLNPARELIEGRADFAIGSLDILLEKDKGEELLILAPIFQRSPNSVFALSTTSLNSVLDLAKLRIAISAADDYTTLEVLALFKAQGIDPTHVKFVETTPTVNTLLDGTADAIATYGISARIEAAELGVQLKELSAANYGLDFYGDTLYTHARLQHDKPELVKKFVRASLKGWQYALQHRIEIARKISQELPRHLFSYKDQENYNQAFAGIINSYMAYPYLQIGRNNVVRWHRMVEELRFAGVIKNQWEVESLFPNIEQRKSTELMTIGTILGLTLLVLVGFYLLRRQQQAWLPYALILSGVVLTEITLEAYLRKAHDQNLQLDATEQLNSVSAKLAGSINSNLSLISGLAAHIAINPQIQQSEFERYGRAVFRQEPLLINLAAAPDMVVRMIYPMKGNKGALGLDYMKNDAQREAVERAKTSGKMIVAGPVNLVQGGVAFIGRTAVFTDNGEDGGTFWGIVSAPIGANELYQAAGLLDPTQTIDFAIRGKDGLGSGGKVFFGDGDLFDNPRSVQTIISVGDGSWQLAAYPKMGWKTVSHDIWVLRVFALALAALLLIFALYRYRQISNERHYQQTIQQNETLLQEVGKLALIGGCKISANAEVSHWSKQCSQVLDMPETTTPPSLQAIFSAFDSEQAETLKHCIGSAAAGEAFDIELYVKTQNDIKRWVRMIGTPDKRHHTSNVEGKYDVIGAVQDITERKQFAEVIEQQATYDLLTGLPNRFLFNNRLGKAIARSKRDERKLAVLFIDLDNFKPVNDNLGHKTGDLLLQEVGRRIKTCVRDSDTVARYSGDEFTVIVHDIANDRAPLAIAEQIIKTISQPYELQTNQIFCTASIGISVYPDDGASAEELVSNADQAMYHVKDRGRNGWHFFTEAMQVQSEKRHILHTKLAAAIAENKLEVYYQPIIQLEDNRVSKCEALARWFDDNQQIPTVDFITLAEEVGMIHEIDRFVLATAAGYLTEQAQTYNHRVGLSINVSPRVFSAKDNSLQLWMELVTEAAKVLDITVEITERLLTKDSDLALRTLEQLKAIGVAIAVDDFGIGYSSLSYLTKFPIDIIKIDRSFVNNLGSDAKTHTLTDAIISLSQKLSLEVVAEGVETIDQLTYIKRQRCNYAQGYYLGKPQNREAFAELLTRESEASSLPAMPTTVPLT
jgi:diguanylate cyclase (GGDEF)-like protein